MPILVVAVLSMLRKISVPSSLTHHHHRKIIHWHKHKKNTIFPWNIYEGSNIRILKGNTNINQHQRQHQHENKHQHQHQRQKDRQRQLQAFRSKSNKPGGVAICFLEDFESRVNERNVFRLSTRDCIGWEEHIVFTTPEKRFAMFSFFLYIHMHVIS